MLVSKVEARRRPRTPWATVVALALPWMLGACAMKSDVRRLENEIAQTRAKQDSIARENARRDQALLDSVRAVSESDRITRGQLLGAINQLSEQINQVASLMGVSQQRLQQLIERQQQQEHMIQQQSVSTGGTGVRAPSDVSADSLYTAGNTALAEKSYAVARDYFEEIVSDHPRHDRAPDALFQIAMTYQEEGDSAQAIANYDKVVQAYPNSERAPQALLNAGRLLEARQRTRAREYYNRIISAYPNSDAVAAARTRLRNLR